MSVLMRMEMYAICLRSGAAISGALGGGNEWYFHGKRVNTGKGLGGKNCGNGYAGIR